jgi:hypothetical protein
MKATIRKDLLEKDLVPPTVDGKMLPAKYTHCAFESYQPNVLDDEEFNTYLWTDDGKVFIVNSIDFNFYG